MTEPDPEIGQSGAARLRERVLHPSTAHDDECEQATAICVAVCNVIVLLPSTPMLRLSSSGGGWKAGDT